MSVTPESYTRQLVQLLPQGRLWYLDEGSVLRRFLLGLADELARVDGRVEDLLREFDPRQTVELLTEWERAYGLEGAGTVAQRQAILAATVAARGGQTPAYFESLALAAGYQATVFEGFIETPVARLGSRLGARLYGVAWAFAWRVEVVDTSSPPAATHAELEAIIRRAAPSHTVVYFEYV